MMTPRENRSGQSAVPSKGGRARRAAVVLLAALVCMPALSGAARPCRAETVSQDGGNGTENGASLPEERLGDSRQGYADLVGEQDPLGVKLIGGIDWRHSYRYDREFKAVSAYTEAGLALGVTPAYVQPSIELEWMPWLPFVLHLEMSGYSFFGTNTGLLSFSSAREPFGDGVRRGRAGTEETGFGRRLLIQPTVQLEVSSFVIRNQSDLAWYRLSGRGPYFLELDYDTLVRNGAMLFANRTQVLREIGRSGDASTLAGPFFEIVHASGSDLTSKRLGLLFYSEQGPQIGSFSTTRWYGQLGYYLDDPNRSHGYFLLLGLGGDFGLK